MASYRFCRTDDISLLVDAVNRCWGPYFPGEPMTPAAFKRSIRVLQVWCSSCMVAFAGGAPIGVLIGAKRSSGTLVHRIAVHPDHRRQGHGGHLLASLGSKLAILGPPRIVSEVPETLAPACELFRASGHVQEAILTDYVLELDGRDAPEIAGRFLIPVTIDDLEANGLLDLGEGHLCWERSRESLAARKDDLSGFAVASDERIEAFLIYRKDGCTAELAAIHSDVPDDGARLMTLFARLRAGGARTLSLPKVHPSEFLASPLETLGFRPAGRHLRFAATARGD